MPNKSKHDGKHFTAPSVKLLKMSKDDAERRSAQENVREHFIDIALRLARQIDGRDGEPFVLGSDPVVLNLIRDARDTAVEADRLGMRREMYRLLGIRDQELSG